MWNLCLFFRCFFEIRWASHEHCDWQVTEQCTQFHSFLSFAKIWTSAFSLSCFWNLLVNSISSNGGSRGGIDGADDDGSCCWLFSLIWILLLIAVGGGICTGIGLYRFALSVCFSLVTCSSQSINDFDKCPQMMQFRSIDRELIKCFNWFLCFLKKQLT